MRVCDYLDAKYGGRGTTILACEAKALGIPYPPPSGWLTTHGLKEITSDAAERLGEALRKSTKDTAPKGLQVLRDAWLTLKRVPAAMDPEFLQSKAWRRLRYDALRKHGNRCQCCGQGPADGVPINVDHIKPRRLFPELALNIDNLQVLGGDCNEGKANRDMTDWREPVK